MEITNFPSNSWGRKTKLLFIEESLPDLNGLTLYKKTQTKHVQLCNQPGLMQLSSSKSPPGKLVDVQDAGKLSQLDDTELHIESQVGKTNNILSSKTTPVCHEGNESSLGVRLREMHTSNTEEELAMLSNSAA